MTKKTICSIPQLSDDMETSSFYSDATNIVNGTIDITRGSMDTDTTISLLSMATKSTIDLENVIDDENPEKSGQYLVFNVTGH